MNNRIEYIDIAKALGMLMIIWGHIVLTGITNSFVYAFHIPLFFFISGMMFSKQKYPYFNDFFVSRVKSLLIPYVIYSVITWIVWVAFSLLSGNVVDLFAPLLQTVIAQGSGGFLVHNVPLWFVTCLFMVEMIYYFISKLNYIWNISVCLVCTILGVWMMQPNDFFDFRLLPWNLEVAMAAMIFYSVGYLFIANVTHQKFIDFVKNNKVVSGIITIVSFSLLFFGAEFNGHVSMGSTHLGNPLVFYGAAFCGIVFMLFLCVAVSLCCSDRMLKPILWFGKRSFDAMAIHNPIKGIIVAIVSAFISNNIYVGIIAFVLTLVITSLGMIIIDKVKILFRK